MSKFEMQPYDEQLTKAVSFEIITEPVNGFAAPGSGKIPFQFPPRIMDDNKTLRWEEHDAWTFEPVMVFKGSDARKITFEATYIVTNAKANGYLFSPSGIAALVRNIKAYAYPAKRNTVPIVKMRLYDQVGDGGTFRLTDIGISHGEALITVEGLGSTFPLMTKIRLGAALITQIGLPSDKENKQDVPQLPFDPKVEWY